MQNILAGHTNSYHTYTLDEALEGIAKAGFKYVELSAVRGWTEHVPLEATAVDIAEIKAKLAHWGLTASALSGHSDLTTAAGLVDGKKAVDLCRPVRPEHHEHRGRRALQRGRGQERLHGQHPRACRLRGRTRGVTSPSRSTATSWRSGALSIPLIQEIDRPNVGINYDTANCVFYGNVQAVDDIGSLVPYLKHVHLKDTRGGYRDWDFPAVGEGKVDFSAFSKILEDEGLYRALQRRDRVQRASPGRRWRKSTAR